MDNEDLKREDQIIIADDVIAIIAGIAASKVDGVSGMSGGFVGNIAESLGRKDLSKGVKVQSTETETSVELFVIVNYGVKIHKVCQTAQQKVREAVQSMTGLEVPSVSVNVQGVELEGFIETENQ